MIEIRVLKRVVILCENGRAIRLVGRERNIVREAYRLSLSLSLKREKEEFMAT